MVIVSLNLKGIISINVSRFVFVVSISIGHPVYEYRLITRKVNKDMMNGDVNAKEAADQVMEFLHTFSRDVNNK